MVHSPPAVTCPLCTAGVTSCSVTYPIAHAVATVASAHRAEPSTAIVKIFFCCRIPVPITPNPWRRMARDGRGRSTGLVAEVTSNGSFSRREGTDRTHSAVQPSS